MIRIRLTNPPSVSLTNWFTRTYPDYPLERVKFVQGSFDMDYIDPYETHLVVSYRESPQEQRIVILGLFETGSSEPVERPRKRLALKLPEEHFVPFRLVDSEQTFMASEIRRRIDWVNRKPDTFPPYNFESAYPLFVMSKMDRDFRYHHYRAEKELLASMWPKTEEGIMRLLEFNGLEVGIIEVPLALRFRLTLEDMDPRLAPHYQMYPNCYFYLDKSDMFDWFFYKLAESMELPDDTENLKPFLAYFHESKRVTYATLATPEVMTNLGCGHAPSACTCPLPLPRCLRTEGFPTDEIRQQLVRCCGKAGVPLEPVANHFIRKNEENPHRTRPVSAKQRWDYETHYERAYPAKSCAKCGLCPWTKEECCREIEDFYGIQLKPKELYDPSVYISKVYEKRRSQ
jgi:hypothetical protein